MPAIGMQTNSGPISIPISTAASGASALVAAPGVGRKIRVLGISLQSTLGNTLQLQSAASNITGAMPVGITGGITWPVVSDLKYGWAICADNEALNLNMGVATQTSGVLVYDVV